LSASAAFAILPHRLPLEPAMILELSLLLALAAEPVTSPAPASEPSEQVSIPEKIPSPDADDNAPTVSIRTGDNGDLIEEYRHNGRVTMVRITPLRGPTYALMDTNGDGRLDEVDGESNGGIAPVYWTIYQWN
jgi:hypothetical protein